MATPLDFGVIAYFKPFIVFLLAFAVAFAILKKAKIFGDNRAINTIISFCFALLAVISGKFIDFVSVATPWIAIFLTFLLLLFAVFMFFGLKEEETWLHIGKWTVVVVIGLILVLSLIKVYETKLSPYGNQTTGKSPTSETFRTILNPGVLGALFILIVAALAIRLISGKD